MKKLSLVDQVAKGIRKPIREMGWEEKIKPEHRAAVEEIRAAWLAGKFGPAIHTASRSIAKVLNESGISSIKEHGVRRWLRGD